MSFPVWLSRAGLPLLGVVGSVVLLSVAAAGVALDFLPPEPRQALFALGVLSWMAGIGWGTWVNARPLPER